MNTLIALGTGAAFLYSLYETVRGGHMVYFEAAAAIIALILLGRTLEARARGKASEAIRRLMDLQPPTARVLRDGAEIEIAGGAGARGRHAGGAAGRAHSGGWRGARGRIGGGRIHAHRREHAGGQARRATAVFAGTINRSGSFRYEAQQGGPRHGAAADDRDGEAGAGLARSGGAAGRRGERLLHRGRAGRGAGHLRRLAVSSRRSPRRW